MSKKKFKKRDVVKMGLRIAGSIGSGVLTGLTMGAIMVANPASANLNVLTKGCLKVAEFGLGSAASSVVNKETDKFVDAIADSVTIKIDKKEDEETSDDVEVVNAEVV